MDIKSADIIGFANQCPQLPRHIAVIMDGNNRWAKEKRLLGLAGHRAGAESARRLVNNCVEIGIEVLTLFAFSSENWSRPIKEVKGLMALFLTVLKRKEIKLLHNNNVRLRFIGNRENFDPKIQQLMINAEELTDRNTGLTVIVAADYGGRWDIAHAMQEIGEKIEQGQLKAEQINTDLVQRFIALGDFPMPDLCIRTGGENRISNFLLWQFAYTELYFTDTYWPDFRSLDFQKALEFYGTRQRRFGRTVDQIGR